MPLKAIAKHDPSGAVRQPSVSRFPPERLGDSELVEAVAQGDTGAVGVVWDRYSSVVRSVLRSNLGGDAAIEDLLQDTFIAFLRGASEIRDPSALRGYLVSVAIRLVLVELRRRRVRRWVMLSPKGDVPEINQPPSDLEGALALRGLYRLLEDLPPRRRVAFVMRQVQGLELAEVATAMQLSESTVKREVRRARRSILMRAPRSEPSLWEYIQQTSGGDDE